MRVNSGDSLVMPSVEIEEAPPTLGCSVQHRENAHECGELTGGQRPPLLHHQVRRPRRLIARVLRLLRLPVAAREERAAAFEGGAVEGHGDDHQQARHHEQGVSRAVGEQQSPVQLHVKEWGATQGRERVSVCCSGVSASPGQCVPRVAVRSSVRMGYLNGQGVDRGVLRVPAVTQRPSVDAEEREREEVSLCCKVH